MDMTGEHVIPADRETVWKALNDPEVLKRCIPGCEELIKESDIAFSAKITAKVGPVKAKFTGAIALSDIDPPNGYTITGEGRGGPAGFAKGGAKVKLSDAEGGGAVLSYEVHAQVGGKLAQIGGRLINSTAKKMAGQFFDAFVETVGAAAAPGEPAAEAAVEPIAAPTPAAEPAREAPGLKPQIWIAAVVALVAAILAIWALSG